MTRAINKWFTAAALSSFLLALCLATNAPAQQQEPESNSPDQAESTSGNAQVAEETNTNPQPAVESSEPTISRGRRSGVRHEAMVVIGRNAELKAGDTAEAVVVIGGSAKIHGKVNAAAVTIGGNLEVDGEVGDAAVAVMGNVRATPNARIHGDAVAVGGKVDAADGASISGQTQEVDIGGIQLPQFEWLRKWLVHCGLLLRPLAPSVGWVWLLTLGSFVFYLLLVLVFPRPVRACADEITRRPATTFFIGLLTLLLMPFLILILAVTGIGLLVVPFIFAALVLAGFVGRAGLMQALGLAIGRQSRAEVLQNPVAAFILGAFIIMLLYLVPVLGLATFALLRIWGLGAALTVAFGGVRREMPEKTVVQAPAAPSPEPAMATAGFAAAQPDAPVYSPPPPAWTPPPAPELHTEPPPEPPPAAPSVPPIPPVLPEALSFPKASFWERMGAGFLDVVLVSILGGFVGGTPWAFLVALAYFAGMWTWRGTTIGGIVLGLKVVRLDGQPITFPVGLVRGLAAALSIVVLFLGFFAIAWDPDRQAWHDKIAGTVVLRLPRGTPLICV